jgi:hypothetical protein
MERDRAIERVLRNVLPQRLAHGRLVIERQLQQPTGFGPGNRHAGTRRNDAARGREPGADGPYAGRAAVGGQNDAFMGFEEGNPPLKGCSKAGFPQWRST